VKTLSPDRIKAFAKFWLVEAIPSPDPRYPPDEFVVSHSGM